MPGQNPLIGDPFEASVNAERAALLKRAGGALSAEEAAELLGVAKETVERRRAEGALLAVVQGGDWRYPRCQFCGRGAVPRLTEVLHGMASSGAWVTLDFLLSPDTVLSGRTPQEALLEGRGSEVLRLVRAEADGDGFS